MASLVLPTNFAYVALVASLCPVLNIFQMEYVAVARKAAKIPYPTYMADDAKAKADPKAYKFNCLQRAHANTLEAVPTYLFCLLYSGLYHPRAAATLGALWTLGRFLYTIGYGTGDPKKRNTSGGVIHFFGYIGLIGISLYVSGKQVLALL